MEVDLLKLVEMIIFLTNTSNDEIIFQLFLK